VLSALAMNFLVTSPAEAHKNTLVVEPKMTGTNEHFIKGSLIALYRSSGVMMKTGPPGMPGN
jgi:hypothetical protein